MAVTDIRWMRVLVGGFLIEITLFAVVLPLNAVILPRIDRAISQSDVK